jgi:hypothetical protein
LALLGHFVVEMPQSVDIRHSRFVIESVIGEVFVARLVLPFFTGDSFVGGYYYFSQAMLFGWA